MPRRFSPFFQDASGHGINIGPYVNALTPEGHCHYCRLPFGIFTPPDISSTPFAPRSLQPVFTSDSVSGVVGSMPPPRNFNESGVTRNAEGHIIGIEWGKLGPESSHLLQWKDRAIGPGHPLATSMDPRAFIPGLPSRDKPVRPLPSPNPNPSSPLSDPPC